MRLRTGLSGGTDGADDATDQEANLKYDLLQVLKDGGNIDAQIFEQLQKIHKMKKKKKKKKKKMKGTGSTCADQLFRNVAAVNRGMRDRNSSSEKSKNKAAFEEFLKKDEEICQKMQNLSSELPVGNDEDFDAESYA